MPLFVGVDWGGADHAACAVDAAGSIVMRLDVRHDADGLCDLLGKLKQLGRPADLPIAIERPSGLIARPRRCRPSDHPDPSQCRARLPPALSGRRRQK